MGPPPPPLAPSLPPPEFCRFASAVMHMSRISAMTYKYSIMYGMQIGLAVFPSNVGALCKGIHHGDSCLTLANPLLLNFVTP